jgi:hypothetical protein
LVSVKQWHERGVREALKRDYIRNTPLPAACTVVGLVDESIFD